jgi:hypothetical protein
MEMPLLPRLKTIIAAPQTHTVQVPLLPRLKDLTLRRCNNG